jgi:hypothetical protein
MRQTINTWLDQYFIDGSEIHITDRLRRQHEGIQFRFHVQHRERFGYTSTKGLTPGPISYPSPTPSARRRRPMVGTRGLYAAAGVGVFQSRMVDPPISNLSCCL